MNMKLINRILPYVYNKYAIAFIIFLTYTLIFDNNNITSQFQMARQLKSLKAERQYYIEEIKRDSVFLVELLAEESNLEKFAREQYLMKKDNEDVFILIGDDYMKIEKKD